MHTSSGHETCKCCPWCETSKKDFGKQAMSGKLRTLGIIIFNSINYQKALNVHLNK